MQAQKGRTKSALLNWTKSDLSDKVFNRYFTIWPRFGTGYLRFGGNTKHRKGPQRTAKELRNTAKDRKGPRNIAKGPQRTTKDRKGAPKHRKTQETL